jgi:hypothetical protein
MQFLAGVAAYIDARSLADVVLLVVVVYRTLPTRTCRRAVIVFAIAFTFTHEALRVQTPLAPVCTPRTRTLDWGQGRAVGPFCACAVSHRRVQDGRAALASPWPCRSRARSPRKGDATSLVTLSTPS